MCAAYSKQRLHSRQCVPIFGKAYPGNILPDETAIGDGSAAVTAAAAVPFMKSLRFILFVIEPIRTAFCGVGSLFLKGRCLHKRSIGSFFVPPENLIRMTVVWSHGNEGVDGRASDPALAFYPVAVHEASAA